MTMQAPTVPISATVGASVGAPVDVNVGVGATTPVDRNAPALFQTNPGDSPDKIEKNWKSDRAARGAAIIDKVTGPETEDVESGAVEAVADVVAGVADAVVAEEPTIEGASEGVDATQEKSRLDRIAEATKKAKNASRARRERDAELSRMRMESASKDQKLAEAQRIASRVSSVEQALRDPEKAVGLIKQLGLTPEQLAQYVLQENTPEAKIQAEAMKRQALENELKAIKDSMAAKEREADMSRRKADFVKRASNATKYPNLVGHPPDMLITLGLDVANKLKAKYPVELVTDHAILSNLDRLYGKAKPKAAAPVEPSKATPAKAAPKTSGTSKPKPEQPRTLTNGQASGSFAKSADWDKLSRTERISRLREGYRR